MPRGIFGLFQSKCLCHNDLGRVAGVAHHLTRRYAHRIMKLHRRNYKWTIFT